VATAQVHWRQGRRLLAEQQAYAGAASKRDLDDRAGLKLLLETLAWMAAEGGRHQRAATLLGCAEFLRRSTGLGLQEAQGQQRERSIALALEGLGQRQFDAAYETGLAMTTDDAVALAIEERAPIRPMAAKPEPKTSLTKRELEIARLIAVDMTNREIATRLFISERTVETHVTNMLNKLGVNSRIAIVRSLPGSLPAADDSGNAFPPLGTSALKPAPGSARQATPLPPRVNELHRGDARLRPEIREATLRRARLDTH
jgi:non-specific serine/threonine protein kinase